MIRLMIGDVRARLAELPAESVQCVVTSPPYWNLRAYGTEPQVWGGDAEHEHAFEHQRTHVVTSINAQGTTTLTGGRKGLDTLHLETLRLVVAGICPCGAWRGELGQEPTPALFVSHLVDVFRAVRRVLRKDGTLWLNVGDSYAGSGKGPSNSLQTDASQIGPSARAKIGSVNGESGHTSGVTPPPGPRAKDLLLIPARVALALQADGWWVRSDIAWCKTSAMPESVTDRPTNAWEHVFLLSRSARYFYDAGAVRQPAIHEGRVVRATGAQSKNGQGPDASNDRRTAVGFTNHDTTVHGANLRNYWLLGPEPLKEAHYAAFPTEIPRRAILAGTSERGCCPECGAPWRRVTAVAHIQKARNVAPAKYGAEDDGERGGTWTAAFAKQTRKEVTTTGWEPTCPHGGKPVPCTVLDPFAGSGTSLLVADRLSRDAIGIDLNPTYANDIAAQRIAGEAPLFTTLEVVA